RLHPHPPLEPQGRDRRAAPVHGGLERQARRPDPPRQRDRPAGVSEMKVVLFCGGLGTRIREYSENVPKPMIPLGHQPILYHVMEYYGDYGHNEFVLCLGYKANVVKDFFLTIRPQTFADCVVSDGGRNVQLLEEVDRDWSVTLLDTGIWRNIGERLWSARSHVANEDMFL